MKMLIVTGASASGKTLLLHHMAQVGNLHLHDPCITGTNAWVPPSAPVDAVALDHFASGGGLTELVAEATLWCSLNACPLILTGQTGNAFEPSTGLPDDRILLKLERIVGTEVVRAATQGEVADFDVVMLAAKAFELIDVDLPHLPLK